MSDCYTGQKYFELQFILPVVITVVIFADIMGSICSIVVRFVPYVYVHIPGLTPDVRVSN